MARISATFHPIVVAAFVVVGLCLQSGFVRAAEPTPWLQVHSAHFTVITDAGEKRGHEVALRFEQMRSVFAILISKDRLNQPLPLTIFAFRNDQTYYQTAPLNEGQPIDAPRLFRSRRRSEFHRAQPV